MKVVIKNRFTDEVIVEGNSYKECFSKCENLRGAYLRGADLRGAYLSDANLSDAYLSDANLSDANLSDANLRGAYLRGAYLRGANLSDTYLSNADLSDTYLSGANLRGAYLIGAYLSDANLSDANLRDTTLPHFLIVPEEGSFYAYKRTSLGVIKVQIPAKAKRTNSLVGRKCRAEYVKVVSGEGLGGTSPTQSGSQCLTYSKGDIIKADKYDDDIRVECTGGIHFFMTKREAEEYR